MWTVHTALFSCILFDRRTCGSYSERTGQQRKTGDFSSFGLLRSPPRSQPSRASRSLRSLFLLRALKSREVMNRLRVMQMHHWLKIF